MRRLSAWYSELPDRPRAGTPAGHQIPDTGRGVHQHGEPHRPRLSGAADAGFFRKGVHGAL